jgi:hypothetical protein
MRQVTRRSAAASRRAGPSASRPRRTCPRADAGLHPRRGWLAAATPARWFCTGAWWRSSGRAVPHCNRAATGRADTWREKRPRSATQGSVARAPKPMRRTRRSPPSPPAPRPPTIAVRPRAVPPGCCWVFPAMTSLVDRLLPEALGRRSSRCSQPYHLAHAAAGRATSQTATVSPPSSSWPGPRRRGACCRQGAGLRLGHDLLATPGSVGPRWRVRPATGRAAGGGW